MSGTAIRRPSTAVLIGLIGLVALLVTAVVTVIAERAADQPPAVTAADPFAPDGPWRTPIPAGAELDPGSAAVVANLIRNNGAYAGLYEFGIPVYVARPDSPRFEITCTGGQQWGPCPIDGVQVPIPLEARPHPGSDGAMVVVDESERHVYEFWRAHQVGDRWETEFGAITDLDGSGWGSPATGSGASRLGGVIRVSEMAVGAIPHAVALQSDTVCAGDFRAPAVKTDGDSSRPDCVAEGTRLRLDPTLLSAVPNMTPAERAVARALQVYGGFVVDRGSAPLSVSFELAPEASYDDIGAVYSTAGLRWDYDNLPGIPWNRLQIMR
jgi:hypothetical protein